MMSCYIIPQLIFAEKTSPHCIDTQSCNIIPQLTFAEKTSPHCIDTPVQIRIVMAADFISVDKQTPGKEITCMA